MKMRQIVPEDGDEDPTLQVEVRQNSKLVVDEDALASLAAQLTEEEAQRCDASMMRRYIRACGGDQKQALRRIRDTLAWFEAERPDHLHCRACARDPKSHYMQVVAWDRGRRPTIYSCLSIPTCRTMEDTRAHMIATFQQAIACMAGGVEDWVWVLDMHGFGLRDIDPRIAFAFLKVSAAHYPERLAQAYIVSAPRIFSTFWHSISPFIDAKTKAKIHFGHYNKHGGNEKLRAALCKNMDDETVHWMMEEMAENRIKAVAHRKHYYHPDLVALARDPQGAGVVAAEARRRAASAGRHHDCLGTPAFLASMAGHPECIPPSLFVLADTSVGPHPPRH
ncbi:hypothetical protein ACKKBG_A14310 [Auxenochlorella protothecoides x Auxenochlorella symbiontica]